MPQTGTASFTFHALRMPGGQVPTDAWLAELDAFVGKLASSELIVW